LFVTGPQHVPWPIGFPASRRAAGLIPGVFARLLYPYHSDRIPLYPLV